METSFVLMFLVILVTDVSGIRYEYMDTQCQGTIDISWSDSIFLQLTRNPTYASNMDCTLRVTTSNLNFNRFMIHFTNMNIESSAACYHDFLEIKDGPNITSPYVSGFSGPQCGSYITSSVMTTTGRDLFLRFKSDSTWNYSGFSMVIVQYHTGACYSSEYECGNGRCIDHDLVCNGYNPCGDYSDCAAVVLAAGAIAGIVIGSIALLFMCTVLIVCFRRRRYVQTRYVSITPGYGTPGYGYS